MLPVVAAVLGAVVGAAFTDVAALLVVKVLGFEAGQMMCRLGTDDGEFSAAGYVFLSIVGGIVGVAVSTAIKKCL